MGERIAKLIEPKKTLPEMRKIFSNRDLKALSGESGRCSSGSGL